jgi:hypothetical protein
MPEKDLRSVQSQATASFLQKLGFNKHFARAVVFGPQEMGGLAMRDLAVEQGIAQIMSMMEHLYHKTETGRLIKISLATLQMEAGTEGPLLKQTLPSLTYISHCWLSSIRDFLRAHQLQLEIAHAWNFSLTRVGDRFLMDEFRLSGFFSSTDLRNLNAVRLYLQVATLADIATADGINIDANAFWAVPSPHRVSTLLWIRQPEVTSSQQALRKKAVRQVFLSSWEGNDSGGRELKLRSRLGVWIAAGHQKWRYYYNPSYDRLEAPISSTQARAYNKVESTSCHTRHFQQVFKVVLFRVDEVTPADMVDRSPQDTQMTAKYDSRWSYKLPRTTNPPSTFQDYVRTLPTYRQRFFAWGRPYGKLEWTDLVIKINKAITDKERLDLAPDGGLTEKGGSFGMVCAKGEEELWEMAGPVNGDTTTANSKRAE